MTTPKGATVADTGIRNFLRWCQSRCEYTSYAHSGDDTALASRYCRAPIASRSRQRSRRLSAREDAAPPSQLARFAMESRCWQPRPAGGAPVVSAPRARVSLLRCLPLIVGRQSEYLSEQKFALHLSNVPLRHRDFVRFARCHQHSRAAKQVAPTREHLRLCRHTPSPIEVLPGDTDNFSQMCAPVVSAGGTASA